MFSTIVLAYDGSDLSKKALDKALEIAASHESRLEVVHSLQNRAAVFGELLFSPSEDYEEQYLSHTQALINKLNEELSSESKAKATLLIGNPALTIVNYAKEIGADLIIVGSRGLSETKELFLGSVSHNIVQHADIPVLVIK